MLVVISDIHFEECRADALPIQGMRLQRNVKRAAFEVFFQEILRQAKQRAVKHIDFVLAGDIFDLHRTQLWFDPDDGHCIAGGPYIDCESVQPGAAIESQLLAILRAIKREPDVVGCLEAIRDFPAHAAAMGYVVDVHYLPGNHDRLVNATPALRAEVIEALGLFRVPRLPFPHQFNYLDSHVPDNPRVLVRHGHEYDSFNFSVNYEDKDEIPAEIPAAHYSGATLGDFVTVDVASRLPFEFRRYYTDQRIESDAVLTAIYWRLIGFDDVRPQAALLNYLLTLPGATPAQAWKYLLPVIRIVLGRLSNDPFLRRELRRRDRSWRPSMMDVVQLLLSKPVWTALLHLPLSFIEKRAAKIAAGQRGVPPEAMAQREVLIRERLVRFVVAGHTHEPQVALLAADGQAERYYMDTGTWRNSIHSTPDLRQFGDLKAMTWVVIHGFDEDMGGYREKQESFSYWSGTRQRWV